jgi:hypothetical protein
MSVVRTRGVRKFNTGGAILADEGAPAVAPTDPSDALKEQIAALKHSIALEEERSRPVEPVDPVETALRQMPPLAQNFLRAHPRYLTNPGENAKIIAVHEALCASGVETHSPEYWAEMERQLLPAEARRSSPAEDEEIFRGENSRLRITSAPPSRSVPQSNGKRYYSDDPRSVDLTAEEKSMVRVAGVSLEDYARGKLELARRKERGEIQ